MGPYGGRINASDAAAAAFMIGIVESWNSMYLAVPDPSLALESPELVWNAKQGWHYMRRPGGGTGYSGPASSGAKKG